MSSLVYLVVFVSVQLIQIETVQASRRVYLYSSEICNGLKTTLTCAHLGDRYELEIRSVTALTSNDTEVLEETTGRRWMCYGAQPGCTLRIDNDIRDENAALDNLAHKINSCTGETSCPFSVPSYDNVPITDTECTGQQYLNMLRVHYSCTLQEDSSSTTTTSAPPVIGFGHWSVGIQNLLNRFRQF